MGNHISGQAVRSENPPSRRIADIFLLSTLPAVLGAVPNVLEIWTSPRDLMLYLGDPRWPAKWVVVQVAEETKLCYTRGDAGHVFPGPGLLGWQKFLHREQLLLVWLTNLTSDRPMWG